MNGSAIMGIGVVVLLLFGIFLLIRKLILWYFKISDIILELEKTNFYLKTLAEASQIEAKYRMSILQSEKEYHLRNSPPPS
jgi:hypothetical protein